MSSPNKSLRDAAIYQAYREGASLRAAASKFDLSHEAVRAVLKRRGEPLRPRVVALRATWRDPGFRKRVSEAVRAGRTVWPDCPSEQRDDYELLRHYMTARKARAALDPAFTA